MKDLNTVGDSSIYISGFRLPCTATYTLVTLYLELAETLNWPWSCKPRIYSSLCCRAFKHFHRIWQHRSCKAKSKEEKARQGKKKKKGMRWYVKKINEGETQLHKTRNTAEGKNPRKWVCEQKEKGWKSTSGVVPIILISSIISIDIEIFIRTRTTSAG